MSDEPTVKRIWPIIAKTYGDNEMAKALADQLAVKLDGWPHTYPRFGAETREEMILHMCWHWFSGGSTAESVAKRIEAVLDE